MARRVNRRGSARERRVHQRDTGGNFLRTETDQRKRFALMVLAIAILVLIATALIARRDDAPRIQLIDVESGAAAELMAEPRPAVLVGPQSATATTLAPPLDMHPVTTQPPATTQPPVTTSAVTTTVAPPATFVPASIDLPSFDATDFPGSGPLVDELVAEAQLRAQFPIRTPTAVAPLRVYVGGDSLSDAPRLGIERAGAVVEVTADTRVSSGLVATWFFDWPEHIEQVVAAADYDVVVLTFGANDAQPLGGDAPPGSDEWRIRYTERIDRIATALQGGPRVVWIGLPPVQPRSVQAIVPVVNELVADAAQRWDHIDYLDVTTLFSDADGQYAKVLPGLDGTNHQVRAGDGVHYTVTAGDWMAVGVLDFVANKLADPTALFPAAE